MNDAGHKHRNQYTPYEQRLWEKIAVGFPNDCWEWKGKIKSNPQKGDRRPVFWKDGKIIMGYRAVYELTKGPIPPGMSVCHTCDNGICCNPAHLFLGTQGDNNRDMFRKGRGKIPRGEGKGDYKLTADQVREIRRLYHEGIKQATLARMFTICRSEIGNIIHRRSWAWLD